jgi:hypothetical protein
MGALSAWARRRKSGWDDWGSSEKALSGLGEGEERWEDPWSESDSEPDSESDGRYGL